MTRTYPNRPFLALHPREMVKPTARALGEPANACLGLAETPRHVVLRSLVGRLREDLLRLVELDEDARPLSFPARLDAEEGCHVGDARGLLHVVGDDHDRVVL